MRFKRNAGENTVHRPGILMLYSLFLTHHFKLINYKELHKFYAEMRPRN